MGPNEDENPSPRIQNPHTLRLLSPSLSTTNINSNTSRNRPRPLALFHPLGVL